MSKQPQVPWDKVVATHIVGWEDGPEEAAVLLVPRFRKGPLARWLQPKLKKPHIRVKLDKVGSFVWRACDGEHTFNDLVVSMRNKFGATIEPAEERLKKFFGILHKDKFVELMVPNDDTP